MYVHSADFELNMHWLFGNNNATHMQVITWHFEWLLMKRISCRNRNLNIGMLTLVVHFQPEFVYIRSGLRSRCLLIFFLHEIQPNDRELMWFRLPFVLLFFLPFTCFALIENTFCMHAVYHIILCMRFSIIFGINWTQVKLIWNAAVAAALCITHYIVLIRKKTYFFYHFFRIHLFCIWLLC